MTDIDLRLRQQATTSIPQGQTQGSTAAQTPAVNEETFLDSINTKLGAGDKSILA